MSTPASPAAITVQDLRIGFGDSVVQSGVSFTVAPRSIFAIMGGSGCGKSTLLRAMIGLLAPQAGSIVIGADNVWTAPASGRSAIRRRCGVLFQGGALWSSLTAAENIALPLRMLTALDEAAIAALVRVKLELVGLQDAADTMPAALSGGMRKRAALARALALEPEILFIDEPSAGLDPVSSRRLDDLILDVRDGFGTTIVMVSHELPSLLAICDDGIFLDGISKKPLAHGAPAGLLANCEDPQVHAFMHRERAATDQAGNGA